MYVDKQYFAHVFTRSTSHICTVYSIFVKRCNFNMLDMEDFLLLCRTYVFGYTFFVCRITIVGSYVFGTNKNNITIRLLWTHGCL